MFRYCLIIIFMFSANYAQAEEKDVAKSKCDAQPYGATIDEYQGLMKTRGPGFTQEALKNAIQIMCKTKYENADRSLVYQFGITDKDINDRNTADLAIALMKGALNALANCDAPPYGSSDNHYQAYAMSITPSLGQETSDKLIAMMCRIKYKGADRSGVYRVGITDKDIDKKDTPDLVLDFMKGVQKLKQAR